MSILKESIAFYKERKREEKQRKTLIRHKMDFALLEQFVQKCNENPDLRIDIHLSDGTVVNMRCYQKRETHDLINGNIYEVK
jgi:Uma2 family endonuclease